MGKIQLTPAELLAQGNEMEALKLQYEQLFQGVEGVLNTTNANWSANLSNNFSDKIKSAQNSFRKVVEMLQFGAEVAKNSANSFESIDTQLVKIMGEGLLSSGLIQSVADSGGQEIPGQSTNIFNPIQDEKKEKAVNDWFSWIKNAAGIYGKFWDDACDTEHGVLLDGIISPISWLKDVNDEFENALSGEVKLADLVDLFGGGMGASGDLLSLVEKWCELEEKSLNSGFLGKLKTLTDIFGLGFDEWEALKDGTYEGFIEHIDDVFDGIGSVTLGVGKWLGITGKGFAGYLEGNKLITNFKTIASFSTHFVGGMIDYFKDDYWIDLEEAANILLDSGSHGGAALLKGVTLGLIDVDADGAIQRYKTNADTVVNWVDSCGGSTGVQIAAGIISSPFVFAGTTVELIMEKYPAKILGDGIQFIGEGIGNLAWSISDRILEYVG